MSLPSRPSWKVRTNQNRRTRSHLPRLVLLEDRTLPSVQFTPGPYAVPGNRPDTALTHIVPSLVEPYLSVNPADPGDIAVSSQAGIRVSTTAGGGFNAPVQFQGLLGGGGGDTSTVYDSAGRLFWLNLAPLYNGIAIAQIDPITGGIISTHTVDQVPDSSFQDDKGWLAADPSNNNLYVIWTRFGPGGDNSTQMLVRYSSDHGVSWSDPVQVDNGSDHFVWPATVTVAPDHHVYAAYHSVTNNMNTQNDVPDHDGKIVVVRFNNDLTAPVRSIAEVPGRADITFNAQTAGFARQIPGATYITQGSAQPWILADPLRPGNVYVISADSDNGFHEDYGDIRIARSTDYGSTWSSSLIETSSALFPNAAIDQNGDIVVAWYDDRRGITNAAGHFKLDVYATYSTDGGLSFAPAFPVNDQTPGVNTPNGNIFDPDPGAVIEFTGPPPTTRIGEYFGIAISGGTADVAWNGNTFAGFNNPTSQQVWTKSFAIRGSLTVTGTLDTNVLIIRTMADNPAFVEAIVNGEREYAGLWSALTGITVDATQGVNVVFVDDTAAGTPITVNFGAALDVLVLSPAATDLSTIQAPVIVHGGAGSQVALHDDANAFDTSYVITGSSVSRPGSSSVSFDHLGRSLNVFGGTGNDTYNVVGSLQNSVSITAQPGSNTLTLNDGSNTAETTYAVSASSVSRTGSSVLSYSNIRNLVLTGGSGTNNYSVTGTPSGSTTLNTGSGVDTVNVRGTSGALFINTGTGSDTISITSATATLGGIGHVILNDPSNSAAVTVDDSGSVSSSVYTVTSSQVAVTAWPNFLLSYNNVASLAVIGSSASFNAFAIDSTASATATTITASGSGSHFDVTGVPGNQYLANIAGPLNLVGSGSDTLIFWDTDNPNAENYTFDDIPSTLALATVPSFAASWSGMADVFLETNGMSTVDDPSGMVHVDLPPPPNPPAPRPRPGDGPRPSAEGWLPAWYADAHKRHALAFFDPSIVEVLM